MFQKSEISKNAVSERWCSDSKFFCDMYVGIQNRCFQEEPPSQWLCHSHCDPGVAGSIPGFSSLSDETINRGPVSI